ncbi:restriction endonuclease subunit S [Salegentibacter sp. LM13S]|uniref:restriction endonuclease subunit S n=1 Tax=Salegentibacter lacus TaxID=2873599 RepID=UPI001CCCE706|nr:restriction endonuclease subunit S [Salegentibacter lacus]MBZ9631247.1 restriction endonuclease subunit S [Salegentibacter lacus]
MAFLKNVINKPITGEWGIEGEKVSVLRTTNFTNKGVLDLSNVIKRDISDKKIATKKLMKGDIIIEKSGGSPTQPVGRVVFFEEEGVFLCNNFTSILRPNKNLIEPKYLHYILYASHKFRVTEMFQNKTTGIINLQLARYIDKIEIPLPSLATQKRIAEILDNATALRDKTKLLLEEYDQLAQSIFLEMFGDPVKNSMGWDIKKLDDLTNLITDGKHGNCNDEKDSGYYFISAKDVRNNNINYSNTREIPKKEFEEVDRRTNLQPGDLVMVNTGSTIGRLAIAREIPETRRTTFQKSVAIIKTKKEILIPEFLQYVFELRLKTFATKGSGSAIKNLLLSEMKRFQIITPPIKLQSQFADKISLLEKQKELAKQELKESEDLFQALLQKAFKGELVKEKELEIN